MSSQDTARKFQFIREIAAGGFGSVYLAKVIHGDGFSRLVAIKLLHQKWTENEEIASRMRDEGRLLGWLRHRNIVDVMDLTMIDGRCAVVMEYLEAVDFRVIIDHATKAGDRIPLRAALEVCSAVCSALDAAYNRPPYAGEKPLRVIHRDIKPSNIMVDEQGIAKVLDFGVARAEFDAREAKTQELSFGSLEYMPPERLFFEPESPASDVYSLGTTLFEMLSLEKLGKAKLRPSEQAKFVEERFEDLLERHPMPSEDVEDILHDLLNDMLAFDETDRPSAADCVSRMRSFARQLRMESLEEWTEGLIPNLLVTQRAKINETQGTLVGQVLTEDAAFREAASVPRGGDLEALVPPPADEITEPDGGLQDSENFVRDVEDQRWSELKKATLDSLQSTGKQLKPQQLAPVAAAPAPKPKPAPTPPPRRPMDVMTFDDEDADDGPTVLMPNSSDLEAAFGFAEDDRDSPFEFLDEETVARPARDTLHSDETMTLSAPDIARAREEETAAAAPVPAPAVAPQEIEEGGTSWMPVLLLATLMLGIIGVLALTVFLVGAAGTISVMATGEDPPTQPAPAPEPPPEPVPEPPPAPPAGPAATFVSAVPDTKKIVVTCDNGSADGSDRAVVAGDAPGDCTVKVQDTKRKSFRVKVEGVEPREYRCFEAGSEECE